VTTEQDKRVRKQIGGLLAGVSLSSLAFAADLAYGGLTFGKATPDDMKAVSGEFRGCQTEKAKPPNERTDLKMWTADALTRCIVLKNRGSGREPPSISQEFIFQRGVLQAVKLTANDATSYDGVVGEVAKMYAEYVEDSRRPLTVVPERRTVMIVSRDQPFRVGAGISPPRLTNRVEPDYPMAARKDRLEGVVVLEAVISASGHVEDLQLVKSADQILDTSAIRAVQQWRYEPATLDGDPVRVYLTVTMTFNLHGGPTRR